MEMNNKNKSEEIMNKVFPNDKGISVEEFAQNLGNLSEEERDKFFQDTIYSSIKDKMMAQPLKDDNDNDNNKRVFEKIVDKIKGKFNKPKKEDYIYKFAALEVREIADIYYGLLFGFYEEKYAFNDRSIKYLGKFIKDEVRTEGGKYYYLYDEICNLEEKLYKMESEYRKSDKTFDPDEAMCQQVSRDYMDLIKDVCIDMFIFGLMHGKSTEKYLYEYLETREKRIFRS